jgi:glycogen debranching enzyme
MAAMAEALGKTEDSTKYKQMGAQLAQKVQEKFWDEKLGYFHDSELFNHFSPDGNLFAVAFGMTTPAQTAKIFAHCDSLLKKNPVLLATEGQYPRKNVSFIHRVINMADYHDDMGWIWQNALYSLAASRVGDKKRAEQLLGNMANLIQRDGNIFEVYDKKSQNPVKRFFYKSEINFSWAAGLYLKAKSEL